MAITCPYCLETYPAGSISRFCNICNDQYKPNFKDNMLLMMGKAPRCKGPGCLGQYSLLRCPKCGHDLPPDIAQYDKYVRFSVVAPSGAGKTNFMTAMIEEVRKCKALKFLVTPMNPETKGTHRNWVLDMYENLRPVPQTERGEVTPMQWRFQDLNRATANTVPPYSVTIFDGAGEDQEALDPLICRYIAGSKMIMLLLDPTRLYGVRQQMTAEEIDLAGGAKNITQQDTQDFISGLIAYLKQACNISARSKITIPVAVVFSKIDAVARNLGNSAMVLTPSGHAQRGKFIRSEAEQIHAEIEGWIDNCGDGLTDILNANLTRWQYFGASAFGVLPQSRSKLQRPEPLRVLDPLIWDLALEGIVLSED